MWWMWVALAWGGYGDPVDGVPSPEERALHVFTNMVRVDPSYFEGDYPCNFEAFTPGERTAKAPLWWNAGLGEAAVAHSEDMYENNHFSHTSSDGTSTFERIAQYYNGYNIGENIAFGYPEAFSAVIGGWMCSAGHRSNIMGAYEELGAGVISPYYTQVFGTRGIDTSAHAIAAGTHWPPEPGGEVQFFAVSAGASEVELILDGVAQPMQRLAGSDASASWGLQADAPDCAPYWFRATVDEAVHTFPEQGSFGFGDCAYDDPRARWFATRPAPDTGVDPENPTGPGPQNPNDPDPDGSGESRGEESPAACGCQHGGSVGGLWAVGALLLLTLRRRTLPPPGPAGPAR